ncbi:MAG: adenosine deaminase [Candidatus Bathyarchaeota archaeon]|nr:adenosine deaminase [Candidatus Bathyarchaeota archaeon]
MEKAIYPRGLLSLLSLMDAEQLIKKLPKAEQHVHIVGSTRPETLLWLAEDSGLPKLFKTAKDARRFFKFRDFPHFIDVYCTVVDFVTKESQLERLTYELLESDARCNVKYVEASFSAPDHVLRGLDYGKMLDAVNRGISRARMGFGVECNIRVDLVRNYGPEKGMEVLDWIESKNDNVVSIDLGGSEERFPAKPYKQAYQRARKMGLHLVAHAGEAAGPESIWQAVNELGVERIGHGVAATDDPALLRHLKTKGIAIEACLTSNVKTRVVRTLKNHPIKTFYDSGLTVTVNTDDPSMFGTDMNKEYLQLHRQLDFSPSELFKLSLNALNSSFLPEESKSRMRKAFIKEYDRLLNKG